MKTRTGVATNLLVTLLCAAPLCAHAQEAIGLVLTTNGSVTVRAADGSVRTLARRAELFEGDTLLTDTGSFVQLRLGDDTQLAIGAGSEFRFDTFSHDADPTTPDMALMHLVRGCFRSVSGTIGTVPGDVNRIATPVADITTRDAVHAAAYDGVTLHTATFSGGTTVANAAGSLDLGIGGNFDFSQTEANVAPLGLLLRPALTENCAVTVLSSVPPTSTAGGDFSFPSSAP